MDLMGFFFVSIEGLMLSRSTVGADVVLEYNMQTIVRSARGVRNKLYASQRHIVKRAVIRSNPVWQD